MNRTFERFKNPPQPTAFVTVYDAAFARLAQAAGAAGLIVGDTVGPLALGLSSPAAVELAMMRHHAAAVRRGRSSIPIIADVPLCVLEGDDAEAFDACTRLAADTGVDALKIESASPQALRLIRRVVDSGISVAAHLEGDGGPNSSTIDDARRVVDAGVACIVLVSVDFRDAATITRSIAVPTIGKNAGPDCDAQVVNAYQALGVAASSAPLRAMLELAIAHSTTA